VSRRSLVVALLVSAVCRPPGPASAQPVDPLLGTWTLVVAQSKYTPGPAPKALAIRFAAAGDGIKVTVDETGADGRVIHSEFSANYDGKEYPITGSPVADSVSLQRVSAQTTLRTDKKQGKVVGLFAWRISPDGKTLTALAKGVDASGQPVKNVLVFARKP